MNVHDLTPQLEADLRAKINPQYVDWKGTESWERKTLFGEIDRVRKQRDELNRLCEFSAETERQLLDRLTELLAAAKNLRDVKGRHHSEQAFARLVEVIAKVEGKA